MLALDPSARAELWRELVEAIEASIDDADELPILTEQDAAEVQAFVGQLDLDAPVAPIAALRHAIEGLSRYTVNFRSTRYFGLFDPAPVTMGIAAEAMTAAFNPQLSAWLATPYATEVERRLVRAFGCRFGLPENTTDGTFTSGGAEANHTAVLTALTHAFPDVAERGVRDLPASPVFYLSEEAHPTLLKAARATGLGEAGARRIPVDSDLRVDVDAIRTAIARDRGSGLAPFMVVATAGTTSAGAIDPLAAVAEVAAAEGLWLHVDAAWGGGAALVPELRPLFAGLESADSITFDPHKLLSVPMGAGLYLTRHADVLEATFHVSASYVPGSGALVNPYTHSLQWSRRFIGLKVLLSLAVAGWEGYASILRHQVAMGELLRDRLRRSGWEIVNETALPLVCFVDEGGADSDAIVDTVNSTGRARIFGATLPKGLRVVRAAITNYLTGPEDIDILVDALEGARRRASKPLG